MTSRSCQVAVRPSCIANVAEFWVSCWTRRVSKPFRSAPFRVRALASVLVVSGLVVSVLLFVRLRDAPSRVGSFPLHSHHKAVVAAMPAYAVSFAIYVHARHPKTPTETESNCAQRESQLRNLFDIEALALVRYLEAYLSTIGNTTISGFVSYVSLLNPDPMSVSAITLYQRVDQKDRAQWVRDFAQELNRGQPPRNDIWTLPLVTPRPRSIEELWPCIVQVPISRSAVEGGKNFSLIGFDPLGEPVRAAPMLRAVSSGVPGMSEMLHFPNDNALGFNIYARNKRPVKTQSTVSNDLIIGVHFIVQELFGDLWAPTNFEYVVRAQSDIELFRTVSESHLLSELVVSRTVPIVDQELTLSCYARPQHGKFWFRYGSHLAALASTFVGLCLASLTLQINHSLERALKSRNNLCAAQTLIKSLNGRATAILQAIDVPVTLVDLAGRMIALNHPAREWMGTTDLSSNNSIRLSQGRCIFADDVVQVVEASAVAADTGGTCGGDHDAGPPTAASGSPSPLITPAPLAVNTTRDWLLNSLQSSGSDCDLIATFSESSSQPCWPCSRLPQAKSYCPTSAQPATLPREPTCSHSPGREPTASCSLSYPHSHAQPPETRIQLPSLHACHQGLRFRPGITQVSVRRPADGKLYDAEVSASASFMVPDVADCSLPPAPLSMSRRVLNWLQGRAVRLYSEASEMSLIRRHTLESARLNLDRQPTTSSSSKLLVPPTSVQQVVLILDRSDVAERADRLERAQSELSTTHQACKQVLLLLCHEMRNPAHVVSGLLGDEPNAEGTYCARAAITALTQCLDQGALLLGQEMDAEFSEFVLKDCWTLSELVSLVCLNQCPSWLPGQPDVVVDSRAMDAQPVHGDPDCWRRIVRILLGLAADIVRCDESEGLDRGGLVTVQLQKEWTPGKEQSRTGTNPEGADDLGSLCLAICIPVSCTFNATVGQTIEDMVGIDAWLRQHCPRASRWDLSELPSPMSPPPCPPDPRSWAGLHFLTLWRQLTALEGERSQVQVLVEPGEIAVSLQVESLRVQPVIRSRASDHVTR